MRATAFMHLRSSSKHGIMVSAFGRQPAVRDDFRAAWPSTSLRLSARPLSLSLHSNSVPIDA